MTQFESYNVVLLCETVIWELQTAMWNNTQTVVAWKAKRGVNKLADVIDCKGK